MAAALQGVPMDAQNEPPSEEGTEETIVLRQKRRIDHKAYAKLYRSFNSQSVANIAIKPEVPPKPRPESLRANLEALKTKYSPSSFGYPKAGKGEEKKSQDENCNVIDDSDSDGSEYRVIVLQQTKSRESIDKIAHELNFFTMDRKEKKRTSSFRKLFTGGFFGKDKKKKEEEKNKRVQNDNLQNESYNRKIQGHESYNRQQNELFNRQDSNPAHHRHYQNQGQHQQSLNQYQQNLNQYQQNQNQHQPNQNQYQQNQNQSFNRNDSYRNSHGSYRRQDVLRPDDQEKNKELEQSYAEMHINRFNQIRKSFTKTQDYLPMEPKPKKSIGDYLAVQKYIDTSSSTSTSDGTDKNPRDFRQTPPRADENNYQNFKVIKPKATHVVAPFKNETLEKPQVPPRTVAKDNSLDNKPDEIMEPRTIERNLDKNHSDKDTYGTVFDSLEYLSRNGEMKPVNQSPQSPKSLEGSKLRLPPNREIVPLQPRVKSPIPLNRISTEKIIATELLRNSRSPTPPRKPRQDEIEANFDGVLKGKPPISPKVILNDARLDGRMKPRDQIRDQVDRATPGTINISNTNGSPSDSFNSYNRSSMGSGVINKVPHNRNPDERYSSDTLNQQDPNRHYDSTVFTFEEPVKNNYGTRADPYGRNSSSSTEIYGTKNEHGLNNKDIYATRADLYGTTNDHGRQKPDTITTNVMVHVPSPTKQPSLVDVRRSSTPVSPQKEDMRKSVEAYYWKELKKMKEKEDYELYMLQMGYIEESARLRRSRSLSPNARMGRRSLSLPREIKSINQGSMSQIPQVVQVPQDVYGRIQRSQFQPQAIPEGKPIYFDTKARRHLTYDQNFVRNTPERSTIGGAPREGYYRPIFRRGSLTKQEMINQNLNKKVSFNPQKNWPTKNGYTLSPPQRRIESVKREDDEVFLSEPVYQYFPFKRQYLSPEVEYAYHPQAVYSSRQSLAELPPTKHVNVRNKICDIYGQIHDSPPIQKSGVIMGQLQSSPTAARHNYNPNFVRGSRLTASANDMQRFQPQRINNYGPPARPLPPVPRKNMQRMSDTESGSDAGEVQRIMSKAKNKGGLFGK